MKTNLTAILVLLLTSLSQAQTASKGEGIDLVLSSKDFGYSQLKGALDESQLPDTLYSSLITVEGTTNNYIRNWLQVPVAILPPLALISV